MIALRRMLTIGLTIAIFVSSGVRDHDLRMASPTPLPHQAVSLLATWQSIAPEGCPYVFMEQERWDYYRQTAAEGKWRPGQDLVNNVLRRFQTLCRRAGAGPYTIHELRRSCITNWAKKLPIHVVQQLAGHSDIQTTRRFYLSVQSQDVAGGFTTCCGITR
jgi:integrase